MRPPARFGHLELDGDADRRVLREAADSAKAGSTARFFVLEPEVFDYIDGDDDAVGARAAGAARHGRPADGLPAHGFWQCMDTLRDKKLLEQLWESGEAPWKVWD